MIIFLEMICLCKKYQITRLRDREQIGQLEACRNISLVFHPLLELQIPKSKTICSSLIKLNSLKSNIFKNFNLLYSINNNSIDCSQLLHQTNREIKSLNYKLMRVISAEECHTIIVPGKQNEIEVIEQT